MIIEKNTIKTYWIIKCTKCGKPGHWSHECKKNNSLFHSRSFTKSSW